MNFIDGLNLVLINSIILRDNNDKYITTWHLGT